MDETSKFYIEQINYSSYMMNNLLKEMEFLMYDFEDKKKKYADGDYVDYVEIHEIQNKAKLLQKRIKECASTINNLSDKIKYDESDFANSSNTIRYRVEIIENNIPLSSQVNTEIKFTVKVKNVGIETWNTNNAYLKITIKKDDIEFNKTYKFNLNADELINIGEDKIFNVSVPAIVNSGMYFVNVCMANDLYDFDIEENIKLYITQL